MLFNSYEFLFVFLPLTLLAFFGIGARGRHGVAMAWLVCASLFFYGWWNPSYLVLLVGSVLVNYGLGAVLAATREGRVATARGPVLAIGVAANLALLGYFKYTDFLLDSFNRAGVSTFQLTEITLPLAISFFTFQQIAYLVDAYRGEAREYNFLHYALFVTFFPQLIAGPIVHHREMLPQFARGEIYRPRADHLAVGITIFAIGLFKKVVLADNAALFATPVFEAARAGDVLGTTTAWTGALAYTFQLYFDFSGYSDMAVGLGRMVGIRLPLNFNSPYKAVNIIEFWRRWHMTLARFLRDYLYIPLGGNRRGQPRRYVNIMITMLLGGLWHGAAWTFVAWGGLHGLYLAVNHGFHAVRRGLGHDIGRSTWWGRLLGRGLTILAVVVGWVFFRAESFDAALHLLRPMFLPTAGRSGAGPPGGAFAWLAVLALITWGLPNTQQFMRGFIDRAFYPSAATAFRGFDLKWAPRPAWAVAIGILGVGAVLSISRISEFLYFQF